MSQHPPANGRQPTMLDLVRLAGERDGMRARAQQLATEVRTTAVSLGRKVDAAKEEADRLRSLLREIYDAGGVAGELQERVARELGIESPSPAA